MTSGLLYVSDLLLIYKKSRAILLSSFPGPRFHDSTSVFLVALSEKIYIAISIHQAIRESFMDLRIGKKASWAIAAPAGGSCCRPPRMRALLAVVNIDAHAPVSPHHLSATIQGSYRPRLAYSELRNVIAARGSRIQS